MAAHFRGLVRAERDVDALEGCQRHVQLVLFRRNEFVAYRNQGSQSWGEEKDHLLHYDLLNIMYIIGTLFTYKNGRREGL